MRTHIPRSGWLRALWRASAGAAGLFFVYAVEAESDLPAAVSIVQNNGRTADGWIFYTQQHGQAGNGPVIIDDAGHPAWYLPLSSGTAADFRVQTYRGQPVLTWAQGIAFDNVTPNSGIDYIYDDTYTKIAEVRAGNGLNSDLHEFELTDAGTALIPIYHVVPWDLSSAGGPADGKALEGVVQEIDIATGAVRFEWHSLDHVGLDECYGDPPTSPAVAYDYFHLNSIKVAADGNLIVSARNTSTVYKIDRHTGAILWRLGGKKSDFAMPADTSFSFALQHNATPVDAGTLRIFDNEAVAPSRVVVLAYDEASRTVTSGRVIVHPARLFAATEGSAQLLPNGDTFVDWGSGGAYSEFDPSGALIYDVRFPLGYASYRAFRLPWTGHPATDPGVVANTSATGITTVHAIWNGATEVANWQIMGSTAGGSLQQIGLTPWNGLDTVVSTTDVLTSAQVIALDRSGAVLGRSATITGPFSVAAPTIVSGPTSVTVATGSSAVLSVTATDAVAYRWAFKGTPLTDGSSGGTIFSGSTSSTLFVRDMAAANAGAYTCVVTNASGTATSSPAIVRVLDTEDIGRLVNVSCRSFVSGGENALITGFVIGGADATTTEPITVLASGPALKPFGVTDVLPDPQLRLYDLATGTTLATAGVTAAAPIRTTAADGGSSRDVTLNEALAPGEYTANVVSPSGGSGVALVEVDAGATGVPYSRGMPRLINSSGRAWVETGANVLIAGFVIGGSTARTVLIRAAGPALAAYGVTGALSNPKLQLFSAAGIVIGSNNGWAANPLVGTIAHAVGAFPWPDSASKDAALLITLPPGAYTAQVSGADGNSGVALVEVYDAM